MINVLKTQNFPGYELAVPLSRVAVHPLLSRVVGAVTHVLRSAGMPVLSEENIIGKGSVSVE